MEMTEITSIISSIGFPIAMVLILVRYINTTQKELIEKMSDISLSISKLCTKMEERYGSKNEN